MTALIAQERCFFARIFGRKKKKRSLRWYGNDIFSVCCSTAVRASKFMFGGWSQSGDEIALYDMAVSLRKMEKHTDL